MSSAPPPPYPGPQPYPPQVPPGHGPGPGLGWGPPGQPPAPPAGGSGGSSKVVLVVLVLAVLGVGAAFFLLGKDDSDGGTTDTGGEASAVSPDQVARSFVEAARNQDCETMLGLVSQASFGGAAAGRDQQLAACQAIEVVPYEFAVTDATVTAQQGTSATVTLTADIPGGTTTEELDLVQEDGSWKVDLAAGEATASASSAGG